MTTHNHDGIDIAIENKQNKTVSHIAYGVIATFGVSALGVFGWCFSELIENKQFRSIGATKAEIAASKAEWVAAIAAQPPAAVRQDLSDLRSETRRLSDDLTRLKVVVEGLEKVVERGK